ncbi:hypothetical protein [Sphingosinicella sp. LY1275]|uniref:hypothetical protein n=1 Tax=Sphingosinicella sp. LY1275 TaxID=3095379 RepID=UPI002ADED259|nr:hypothetical protein [Sphingosinicella sp. LY1275]MEA1014516.1 hypothetical protein [Sphingosinicella sp. LY1275]
MKRMLFLFLLSSTGPAPAEPQPVEQVGDRSAPTGAIQQVGGAPARHSFQLTSEMDSTPSAAQVAPGGRDPQAVQLYKGDRTAQPLEALSSPGEGRTADVVRVAGRDRCDPAEEDGPRAGECRNVIESRAAEFEPPAAPALSPEERLLVTQHQEVLSIKSAARQLAGSGPEADSLPAQGIASQVLRRPSDSSRPEETGTPLSAEVAAIVNAIAGGGGQVPN